MQQSTQVIRNINAARATANESPRYTAQYKGDHWYVYDARVNAWGTIAYPTAVAAQERADKLNAVAGA